MLLTFFEERQQPLFIVLTESRISGLTAVPLPFWQLPLHAVQKVPFRR